MIKKINSWLLHCMHWRLARNLTLDKNFRLINDWNEIQAQTMNITRFEPYKQLTTLKAMAAKWLKKLESWSWTWEACKVQGRYMQGMQTWRGGDVKWSQAHLIDRISVLDFQSVHRTDHRIHGHEDVLIDQLDEVALVIIWVSTSVDDTHLLDECALAGFSCSCNAEGTRGDRLEDESGLVDLQTCTAVVAPMTTHDAREGVRLGNDSQSKLGPEIRESFKFICMHSWKIRNGCNVIVWKCYRDTNRIRRA